MFRYKSRDWNARITRARSEMKVSEEGLCAELDRLGINGAELLSRVRGGESHLTILEVFAVAAALNAPPEWLTGDDDNHLVPTAEQRSRLRDVVRDMQRGRY